MLKLDFNQDWTVRCLTREAAPRQVSLPHDAMREEPRVPESRGEGNIGWYLGGDYTYTKTFPVPAEWEGAAAVFEFEGVYHNAEIYLNGRPVLFRPYGYTNFYVPTDGFLHYGEDNEIMVVARNADQPNSRWYSGTGLYRPVWLWLGAGRHVELNGVKIRTVDYRTGEIEIRVHASAPGPVTIEILDGDAPVTSAAFEMASSQETYRLHVPGAKLWDTDHPNLYTARVTVDSDVVEERFGIRTLAWNTRDGLTLNGKRVILRGACIHHDNGVLGACAFPEAEERKVRLHKENGYNALRSAHNPCSKALLDACDRLGMLMMDEYADGWTLHKTKYDYVTYLSDWWRRDLREMVDKDFNHPSVILYSTGNEVAETARADGIELTGEMTQYLHSLDDTRPVTCGINIFFNFLSSAGFGMYSDEKAEREAAAAGTKRKKKAVGSEFYNRMTCILGDRFMKFGATLPPSDVKTRDAYAKMDVAGYNYGIWRYRRDLKKYPQRLILGTETFCKDAWLFWEIAKDNPRVLGDFVWAGMDYIGETGIGAPEYGNYKMAADEAQMTGGNGRIDLTGKPRAEAAWTKVALGQADGPYLAVRPVDRTDNPGLTGWTFTRAVKSWSWEGCEGWDAVVEVYARGDTVELFLNGVSVGFQSLNRTRRAVFRVPYEPGQLPAVVSNRDGVETGRQSLTSSGPETVLRVLPEETGVKAGGLAFVRLRYTDAAGLWKPQARHRLKVTVLHGELAGLGCANAYVQGNFTEDVTDTYYGEALAVVRADGSGDVTVTAAETDSEETASAVIPLLASG